MKHRSRNNPKNPIPKNLRRRRGDTSPERLYAARYRAKKNGLTCTLTFERIKALIEETGGICPVFFVAFIRGGSGFTLSLDRIFNSDYSDDSVRIICCRANSSKGDKRSVEELRSVMNSKLDPVDRELLIDYIISNQPNSGRN